MKRKKALLASAPSMGNCLVIPSDENHYSYSYKQWNDYTTTELKLRRVGREIGGGLLNITGMNIYYLEIFHDVHYRYDKREVI